jgi:hypothetical protein
MTRAAPPDRKGVCFGHQSATRPVEMESGDDGRWIGREVTGYNLRNKKKEREYLKSKILQDLDDVTSVLSKTVDFSDT